MTTPPPSNPVPTTSPSSKRELTTLAWVLEEPTGPWTRMRPMRVVPVPDSHDLGPNVTWDAIRDQVVVLLDEKKIKFTSVDFVRFTWLNPPSHWEISDDEDNDSDEDNKDNDAEEEQDLSYSHIRRTRPVENGVRHYTNPTIWIGVLPGTLTGTVAHDSSKDIRAFLDSLDVQNIDIAYRESLYKPLAPQGPALFPPADYLDALLPVIDNVSVALGIPIVGRETTMEGTLGPYFRVGDKLYAITVRHNLFSVNEDNDEYHHDDSAPKEVMVMSAPTFKNYLISIQGLISTLLTEVSYLERKIALVRSQAQDGINVDKSQEELGECETEVSKLRTNIEKVKKFFVNIKQRWSKAEDRVIGFVRWAPPIGFGVPPHRYTRDLCVIELDKEKFRFMIGNVLNFGFETPTMIKLHSLICEWDDGPSYFQYPIEGFLALRGMLTADQFNSPTTPNLKRNHVRRVLKRGFKTNVTVGTLTRYLSFVRQYFQTGNQDSLEVAILNHERDKDTFSKVGDSGSLIVSHTGEFVALLAGGTDRGTKSSDITYATLFEWVWDLVKAEFPGASLDFDNLEEFLADVA